MHVDRISVEVGFKPAATEYTGGYGRFSGLRQSLKRMTRSKPWLITEALCLCFALSGWSIWIIFNIPDDPWNLILDVIMVFIMSVFIVEVIVNCLIDWQTYPLGIFFWMDIMGAVSLIFDISFLLGTAGKMQQQGSVDSVLIRTARAGKIGSRIGRLAKIIKVLPFLLRAKGEGDAANPSDSGIQARHLSRRLMLALSTKITLLTLALVLAVHLFSSALNEEDLSMRLWGQKLEADFQRAVAQLELSNACATDASTIIFQQSTEEMKQFYRDVNYYPFMMEGFDAQVQIGSCSMSIPGAFSDEEPMRKQSILRLEVSSCLIDRQGCNAFSRASIYYNFTVPSQWEAGMDLLLIFFIVCFIIYMTVDLNRILDALFVKPVEKLLNMVQNISSAVIKQFNQLNDIDSDAGDEENLTEAQMLETIFQKVAKVADLSTKKNVATQEQWNNMTHEGKGVMMEIMNVKVRPKGRRTTFLKRSTVAPSSPSGQSRATQSVDSTRSLNASSPPVSPSGARLPNAVHADMRTIREAGDCDGQSDGQPDVDGEGEDDQCDNAQLQEELHVKDLPVSTDEMESWSLDTIELREEGCDKVVVYILFDSSLCDVSGCAFTDISTFNQFHSQVRSAYSDMPYHNYAHACDVLHMVFRLLCNLHSLYWLSDIEQHALLVAALCHDMGHQGKTNAFLIETQHELALRYNDKSPLENMHCAKLFEICSQAKSDVFEKADRDTRKLARKVCIETILHTDNAKHFEMVNEIKKVYELSSDICDMQASNGGSGLNEDYEVDLLGAHAMLWLEFFLHLADVSNPLKPFKICEVWAYRVMDEFFAQGDAEKGLGIPVGMLNDRAVVDLPGTQFDFINFLVSPLAASSVLIFPQLHALTTQMTLNLEEWRNIWLQEKTRTTEEVARRENMLQEIKKTAEKLRMRSTCTDETRAKTCFPAEAK